MTKIHKLLLLVVSAALYDGKIPTVEPELFVPLLKESVAQAVFPLVFSALDEQMTSALDNERYAKCSRHFFKHTAAGAMNFEEHGELHRLMAENDVPYVVIKGLASAMYYPEPLLRNMGDVDFLVAPKDMDWAGQVLESHGFSSKADDDDGIHVAYFREPISTWEMHRSVNGVPDSLVGKRIKADLSHTIETSTLVTVDDVVCRVPDKYHHGLILLLHTASHLTSEGVGLRHLCDFVLFSSSLDDREFRELFEDRLKSYGLWRFARSLYMLGEKYLNAPRRSWAEVSPDSRGLSPAQLLALLEDILSGGNFGKKDMNRYREIKYISDKGERTVSGGGILSQGLKSLNGRVYADFKSIEKHRILLPLGYVAEGGRYVGLLLSRKRKSSDTAKMLKEAQSRKKLYSSLELFREK